MEAPGGTSDFDLITTLTPVTGSKAIYSHFLSKLPNDVQLNNIGEQFPGLPGGGQESARPRYSLAWHSSLTSTISNELRFGFSSSTPTFFNREDFSEGYRLALPLITTPIQNFLQQGRAPRNHNLIDNASWVKGNHVIKFGGSARWVKILNFNDGGIVPQYTVGFNTTINPCLWSITLQFPGWTVELPSTRRRTTSWVCCWRRSARGSDIQRRQPHVGIHPRSRVEFVTWITTPSVFMWATLGEPVRTCP